MKLILNIQIFFFFCLFVHSSSYRILCPILFNRSIVRSYILYVHRLDDFFVFFWRGFNPLSLVPTNRIVRRSSFGPLFRPAASHPIPVSIFFWSSVFSCSSSRPVLFPSVYSHVRKNLASSLYGVATSTGELIFARLLCRVLLLWSMLTAYALLFAPVRSVRNVNGRRARCRCYRCFVCAFVLFVHSYGSVVRCP